MARKKTIFEEIIFRLNENVIPSIILSLNEIGMQYCHILINPQHSLCFFHYLGINFPFNLENSQTIKDENGNDFPIIIFSIERNGKISVSENINTGNNGAITLINNFILFDDFNKMFQGICYENAFLFHLSKELTERAKLFQLEIETLKTLLNDMEKIKLKITREVLVEKINN